MAERQIKYLPGIDSIQKFANKIREEREPKKFEEKSEYFSALTTR